MHNPRKQKANSNQAHLGNHMIKLNQLIGLPKVGKKNAVSDYASEEFSPIKMPTLDRLNNTKDMGSSVLPSL